MELLNDVGTKFEKYRDKQLTEKEFWSSWVELQKRIVKMESEARNIMELVGCQENE